MVVSGFMGQASWSWARGEVVNSALGEEGVVMMDSALGKESIVTSTFGGHQAFLLLESMQLQPIRRR